MNFWKILRNNEKWLRSLKHQYPAESDRIKRLPVTKEDFRALKKLIQRNAFQGRTWDVSRLPARSKGR